MTTELREKLAAIEHERWADWQRYQHSKMRPELKLLPEDMSSVKTGNMVMPKESFEHWESQIIRPYSELSDQEKASDMEQVDRYWPLVLEFIEATCMEVIGTHDNMQRSEYMNRGLMGLAQQDLGKEILRTEQHATLLRLIGKDGN